MSLSGSSSERSFNSEDSGANLAEVEDERSDRKSQVSCESLENDIAYVDEPLADEEWLKKYEEVDETNKLEQELRKRLKGQFKWILGECRQICCMIV